MSKIRELDALGDDPKQAAAEHAVRLVRSGMVVGLGTGSTAKFAVEAIGRKLASGELERLLGVPTSTATHDLAVACGISLTTLNDHPDLDLTIDGADEVDPRGNLVKGGGGALLWEKMVAAASRRLVIVVDESKLVTRLCDRMPLPVEVVRFGWRVHEPAIRELGARPVRREAPSGDPFVSDEGHYIIDCHFAEGLPDPAVVGRARPPRAGVVETGLFLGMEPDVVVGRRTAP